MDRALGNYERMMKFGHTKIEYDLPQIFDHAPLILSIPLRTESRHILLKFCNVWVKHEQFLPILIENWSSPKKGNKLLDLWNNLMKLKILLK